MSWQYDTETWDMFKGSKLFKGVIQECLYIFRLIYASFTYKIDLNYLTVSQWHRERAALRVKSFLPLVLRLCLVWTIGYTVRLPLATARGTTCLSISVSLRKPAEIQTKWTQRTDRRLRPLQTCIDHRAIWFEFHFRGFTRQSDVVCETKLMNVIIFKYNQYQYVDFIF